jgi:hypothetical protein
MAVISACPDRRPRPRLFVVPVPERHAVASPTPTATPDRDARPDADGPDRDPAPTPATGSRARRDAADPSVADRLPLAVMIDDNVIARPQSGFNAASIVYQAPADGGEDYMLVFRDGWGRHRSGPQRPAVLRLLGGRVPGGIRAHGGDEKTLQKVIPRRWDPHLQPRPMFGSGRPTTGSAPQAPTTRYTSTASLWTSRRQGLPADRRGIESAVQGRRPAPSAR